MALQKVFKKEYAQALYDMARRGEDLQRYTMDVFPYDDSKTYFAARVIKPEGLLDSMPVDDDYAAAIALYEAYKDLTPLQASDEAFWIYLGHADLYQYVHKRYGDVFGKGINSSEYVSVHWFFKREIVRNALAGLYWDVRCTIDETQEDKYKYTKYLFDHYDMRMINFANYTLFRNKEQVIGMIQFLIDHPDIEYLFPTKFRKITKYFNALGATKQLASLKRDFFYNELNNIWDKINIDN